MQAVDQAVLKQVQTWLTAGQPCWLATVVRTWGSSPRPVGSLLACNGAGVVEGSLSGGCVEDDLLEKLLAGELAHDHAQQFKYGVTAEETERLGLPCGGHLYVVVEPLQPDDATRSHMDALNTALAERRCITRRVDLGERTLSHQDAPRHQPLRWDESRELLEHTCGPRHQLFVIGAGMVSKYLAQMAVPLDYQVTVCDPREHLIDAFDVEGVKLVNDMPDDAVRAHAADPASAIVALTHDPRIDDMGLLEALNTNAFYVGAMGSTRTSASRRERLGSLGISKAKLDRLHAPIGLAIGSKTPPEIAIAILAEITAVRTGRVAALQERLAAASAA